MTNRDAQVTQAPAADGERTAEYLLSIVTALATELRPNSGAPVRADPDCALDRDLGLDSLARVELIRRIERAFGVRLPEQLIAVADSPRDLWRAVQAAPSVSTDDDLRSRGAAAPQAAPTHAPHSAQTLLEALAWHVDAHGERQHVLLYEGDGDPRLITYQNLHSGALALVAGLQAQGVTGAGTAAIMLPTGYDYLRTFLAILMAGGVPVPIYPPARPSQLEEHLRRHAGILRNARAVSLITVPEARGLARTMLQQLDTPVTVATVAELTATQHGQVVTAGPDDIAFLQYTSGSTGSPKGVVLTHDNLLSNIRAMGEAAAVSSRDVFVSWLPLYHDMGLIGAWLNSLYFGMPLVLMSPLAFLAQPSRWLWALHRHRGTLSAAPNFAYELCLSKLSDEEIDGLDLSCWRMAFNGAEQVSPQTLRRFRERFAPCGLRPTTLAPVYGLAEAAVGLAFPPLGREPLIDRVERERMVRSGEARPISDPGADAPGANVPGAAVPGAAALEFVACGQPLPGYQIRVVDDERELPERRVGQVQFQGPSATSGYYRNPDASRRLHDGAWLDTGDLGYIARGDLFVTGRSKDVIIRAGRNIYPHDVEQALGDIPGIRRGCVAMFGCVDPGNGTERVVIVAETRATGASAKTALRQACNDAATRLLDMPPDDIVLAPPQTVLKTSSGKLRRAAVRERYERGSIGREPRAVWWQLLRLKLSSAGPRARRLRNHLRDAAYANRVRLLFWVLAPPVWLAVVVAPTLHLRWQIAHGGARLLLRLASIPLQVAGTARLPDDQAFVVVANHASYLDGLALVAALPRPVGFIAKGELKQRLLARLFLSRIGAHLVERFDWRQGASDAEGVIQALRRGRALLFFPEGTLTRAPGLLSFHMGAFVAAVNAGVALYPLVIRGTRSILRGQDWYPHRGHLQIAIGEPLHPSGQGWSAAVALRDEARARMLAELGEPDLASDRAAVTIDRP